jgi:hypothetical protein
VSGAELFALRSVLADRRRALLDRLAVEAAEGKPPTSVVVEPGFLRLLSDLQTTIAAVDDELAESVTAGETP